MSDNRTADHITAVSINNVVLQCYKRVRGVYKTALVQIGNIVDLRIYFSKKFVLKQLNSTTNRKNEKCAFQKIKVFIK